MRAAYYVLYVEDADGVRQYVDDDQTTHCSLEEVEAFPTAAKAHNARRDMIFNGCDLDIYIVGVDL